MTRCKVHLKILSYAWIAVVTLAAINGISSAKDWALSRLLCGLVIVGTGFFMVLHRGHMEEVWPDRALAKDPVAILVIGCLWIVGGIFLIALPVVLK